MSCPGPILLVPELPSNRFVLQLAFNWTILPSIAQICFGQLVWTVQILSLPRLDMKNDFGVKALNNHTKLTPEQGEGGGRLSGFTAKKEK